MSLELITKDDLEEFRTKLLADLKQFINPKKELENKITKPKCADDFVCAQKAIL